jgi:hypothetical protein
MSAAGETRPRLLNPSSTAAVVLGAHDWAEAGLGRAPSFLRSARRVVAYLYDPGGLRLDPELVLDLFDDMAGAGDQLARVRDTLDIQLHERREEGRPVTDLLVYYIGHGYTDDRGHLSLLVRRSRRGLEAETGIKAPDLARTLRLAAPQQRRSVILDCCFSEAAARAFMGMAGDLNQQVAATVAKDLGDDQPARGTLLLCSSPVGEVSMGAPNAERTLFTGAVLEVLQQGAEGRPPYLSFADLRDAAFDRMVVSFGANAPRPALHQVNAAQGDLTRAPAFPNRAAAVAGTQALPSTAFTLEMLSRTMSNPEYTNDFRRLEQHYAASAVINPETIIIVVGTSLFAELLDRPVAELLRDDIDSRGSKEYPFRRAIVLTDEVWYAEENLRSNPVIAIGGPGSNKLSAEFDRWEPSNPTEGKYRMSTYRALIGFFRPNAVGSPQVGLWGNIAPETRDAVSHYIQDPKGLRDLLGICWK